VDPQWDEMITVGRVARTHGNRGQVIVNLETDFPHDRFRTGAVLYVVRGGTPAPLTVTAVRFHQGRPVIGLEGVDSMTAAEALAGVELRVPAEALHPLPDAVFYRHDLVGCDVRTVEGLAVGTVAAVEGPLERSRLVVRGPLGEVLIPLVAEICVRVAPADRLIEIRPPDGLLELNR